MRKNGEVEGGESLLLVIRGIAVLDYSSMVSGTFVVKLASSNDPVWRVRCQSGYTLSWASVLNIT